MCLFDAATTIPGYSPKGNITEEEFKKMNPQIKINDITIDLKYCNTCKIIREIRSFHCNLCGCCVKRHDHHCGFISNCVGKNNTNKFFFFLCSVLIHCLVLFISCLIQILNVTMQRENTNYWKRSDYVLVILCVVSGIFFLMLFCLVIYHCFLFSKNQTTNENLRMLYDDKAFDKGCWANWREVFHPEENEMDHILLI